MNVSGEATVGVYTNVYSGTDLCKNPNTNLTGRHRSLHASTRTIYKWILLHPGISTSSISNDISERAHVLVLEVLRIG